MLEFLSKWTAQGQFALSRHSVKNVMTPMIWLCAVTSSLCFAAAVLFSWQGKDTIAAVLVGVGVLPIVTACTMYIYFGLRDPDRLHTEDFRIKQRVLEITDSKGGKIAFEPVGLVEMANPFPEPKALPPPAAEQEEN